MQGSQLVLLVLLAVALVLGLLWPRWRLRRRLKAVLRPGARHYWVACFLPEDLPRWQLAQRNPLQAVLELGHEAGRLCYELAPGQWRELDFPRGQGECRYLNFGGLLTAVPNMVRLSGPAGVRYLRVQNLLGLHSPAGTRALHAELSRLINPQREFVHSSPPLIRAGLVAASLLLLAALPVMVLGAFKRQADFGPSLSLALSGGELLAAERERLLRFDSQGRLLQQKPLSELGVARGLASLALDATGEVLLGDFAAGVLRRCAPDLSQCKALPGMKAPGSFRRTFKVQVSQDGRYIYGADTARHELVILDREGRELQRQRPGQPPLCFPNSLSLGRDGRVYLADTNNHRLLAFTPEGDGLAQRAAVIGLAEGKVDAGRCAAADDEGKGNAFLDRAWQFEEYGSVHSLGVLREGRIWPSVARQDDEGWWWVLVANDNMRRADLVRFNEDFSQAKRIDLPPSADPTDLAILAERVVVVDPAAGQMWSVTRAGLSVTAFGDAAFTQGVQSQRLALKRMELLYRGGLGGILAAVLLLGLVFLPLQRGQLRALAELERV